MVAQLIVNRQLRLCLAIIQYIVNSRTQLIVDELERGCQAIDNHTGQIFEVS